MKFKKYTKEQLINAVATSTSIRQALIKLNVKPYGGNYAVIKSYIKELNLDISHFQGQSWSKGKTLNKKIDTKEYLLNKKPIQTYKLKKRLLNEGYFENECLSCGLRQWLGNPIPLELHHLDGNPQNNLFENLSILCPNCHALTENYRGKNKSFQA